MSTPQPPLTRFLLGALAGAALGLVGWLVVGFAAMPGVFTAEHAAAFVVLAGIVCGLGRLMCGGLIGPALGVVVGFAGGLAVPNATPPAPAINPAIGRPVEVSGPTLDGGSIDLASLRGQVVLVDFWATWCPPCVEEIPGLRDLYAARNRDGFTVVGVSLDRSRDKLQRYVQSNDIAWPQIYFPEQDKNQPSPVARQHRVEGIPHTLLIDREGNLAAVGLRGKEVNHAVNQLLAGRPLTPAEPSPVPGLAWWLAIFGGLFGTLIQSGAFAKGAGPSK